MKKYKNKETNEYEELEDIKKEYRELLGNSNEFNEYIDDFDLFLSDYYEEEEEEEEEQ